MFVAPNPPKLSGKNMIREGAVDGKDIACFKEGNAGARAPWRVGSSNISTGRLYSMEGRSAKE